MRAELLANVVEGWGAMTDWAQLDPKPLRALAEWLAPDSAETAEDLWQVLLTRRPGRDTVPMGAASLLTKHHG
ncbi:MAG TPA: hypothetical protein VIJ69_03400 [Actinomycetota bacterium]